MATSQQNPFEKLSIDLTKRQEDEGNKFKTECYAAASKLTQMLNDESSLLSKDIKNEIIRTNGSIFRLS